MSYVSKRDWGSGKYIRFNVNDSYYIESNSKRYIMTLKPEARRIKAEYYKPKTKEFVKRVDFADIRICSKGFRYLDSIKYIRKVGRIGC